MSSITAQIETALIRGTLAELAWRFESLNRLQLLNEKQLRVFEDLSAGRGVEKLVKIVTVPASGTNGLTFQIEASDELLELVATLRALESDARSLYPAKATTGDAQ
ncbi:MAG: hypothetical protein ACK5DL_09230 [Burkholderiales bacterium]|jgi:hypothetical protein